MVHRFIQALRTSHTAAGVFTTLSLLTFVTVATGTGPMDAVSSVIRRVTSSSAAAPATFRTVLRKQQRQRATAVRMNAQDPRLKGRAVLPVMHGAAEEESSESSYVREIPAPQPVCGNGYKEKNEGCDDGNTRSGDGCSKTCILEPGYHDCDQQGYACRERCGDGEQTDSERCDDGNVGDGDGCTSHCTIEPGYLCSGTPSVCSTLTN